MPDRMTSRREGGVLYILWECSVCHFHNREDVMTGTSWYCAGCNRIDRDVEMRVENLAESEQLRRGIDDSIGGDIDDI